ncbi:coiled-coil domain-containing protein 151 [Thrips palmi]|uniref:Coiled-coil domain-containing protein 151 n=1 Tax=Thrips palmi TaxID=161013 RepID=A0A6P8Y1M0_THRPL|nr:coiled-coil domain-containing protein 151 [Thrips palmi]XP_034233398.1 coiled-coil domain-containing protein 151 [Thrips palmi]
MPYEPPVDENDLNATNKNIIELKKKIQLSEGQRKAHYEECESEKKRNAEKIRQLKKEVKELRIKLSQPPTCDGNVLKKYCQNPKETCALREKKNEDAVEIMDLKVIDLKKKLDLLRFRSKQHQEKMKSLADEYKKLLTKKQQSRLIKNKSEAQKERNTLENHIHRIEMNMMEADHVKRKYLSIRASLLDDSVEFESSLRNMEDVIVKQDQEIKHLEDINNEALALRDSTKSMLLRQEASAMSISKARERQLQEFKMRVEERKSALEQLERRIFPTGRPVMQREDSQGTPDSGQVADDDCARKTTFYENAFLKLKEATGVTETEEVLQRFLGQKETKSRLTYLRKVTEDEKRKLEKRKEVMMAQLEAFKFAEVKDKEVNVEEMEHVKLSIKNKKTEILKLEENIKSVSEQLCNIKDILHRISKKIEAIDDVKVPEATEDLQEVEIFLKILESKIQNALSRINLVAQLLDQTNENSLQDLTDIQDNTLSVVSSQMHTHRTAALISAVEPTAQEGPCPEELWQFSSKPGAAAGAMGGATASTRKDVSAAAGTPAIPETDEEEECPTRSFLKRQAQLIVDAKSRRKAFRGVALIKSRK